MKRSMYVKNEYRGSHSYRIDTGDNTKERIFLKAWQDQKGIDMLRHILSRDMEEYTIPSKRDIFVANSIIQWLGTSVGQGFLAEVEDKSCESCGGHGNLKHCQDCAGTGFKGEEATINGLIIGEQHESAS